MILKFKELFKISMLGDLKRPPKFYGEFKSPTIKDFHYAFAFDPSVYGNKHYSIKMTLEQECFTIQILWRSSFHMWNVGVTSTQGNLSYQSKYYKFSPEVKQIIDFMCTIACREHKRVVRREALADASREINIFREILPKLEELETKETAEFKHDDARNCVTCLE